MASHHRNERRGGGDRDPRSQPAREAPAKRAGLNEYWIDGEGISREVLQGDICRFLGAEATSRPGDYNGRKGFKIKALRPFTPEMLEDLRAASRDYGLENSALRDRYREEVPYEDSETRSRRNDPDIPSVGHSGYPGSSNAGYAQAGGPYPSELPAGYPGMSYNPSGSNYPSGSGYPPTAYSSMAPNPGSVPAYAGGSSDPRYQPHYTYAQPQGRDYPQQNYYTQAPGGYGAEPPRSRGEPLPPGYAYRNPPGGHAPEEMPREYGYEQQLGRGMPPAPGGHNDPYRGQAPSPYDDPSRDPYGSSRQQPESYNQGAPSRRR